MQVHAFRQSKFGGPNTMKWVSVAVPTPGPGEVVVRHKAVGLNLFDTYRRAGVYPVPLPTGLGGEAAGVVEATGPGVRGVKVGTRVGYFGAPVPDAYSEARLMPAQALVPLPDDISYRQAAAMLLKGLTAHYLLRRTYRVGKGDTIVVHAAAGGVGLIMCQWANALGATVIGLVSSEAKARLVRRNGCRHPLVVSRTRPRFAKRVRELTDGAGAMAVYDSVGRTTWDESLKSVGRLGTMVSFGNASGAIAPVDVNAWMALPSPAVVRASLVDYTATPAEVRRGARELFAIVRSGAVKIRINQTYKLADAPQAHRDLEARRTTGSTVLIHAHNRNPECPR